MSLLIYVDAYSGYKASERPRQFVLDEEIYEIAGVLDQWYEPSAKYFKVQGTEVPKDLRASARPYRIH